MARRWFHQAKACTPCIFALGLLTVIPACGPNYEAVANKLRETNLKQEREIGDLKGKLADREARLKQAEGELAGRFPPVETLPPDRLSTLYTANRIEIRPQTDAWAFENGKGLAGFRVFFRTLSEEGVNVPATGKVTIEALELGKPPAEPRRVGTWEFSAADVKKSWYNGMGLNQFALNCPWEKPPTAAEMTFRITFLDALTGRTLEGKLDKKVSLSPAGISAPAATTPGNK